MSKKSIKRGAMAKLLLVILFVFIACFSIFFIVKSISNSNNSGLAVSNEFTKLKCEEFKEDILWSDDFINSNMGSASYYTWKPRNLCNETKMEDCFLQSMAVNSRIVYISNDKEINGEGYVQISNLDETECNNPEKGEYNDYLAYEKLKGIEGIENNWYCGYEKNDSEEMIKLNPKCELTNKLNSSSGCFGIKAYASPSTIIDVFKIKYSLCWEEI